MGNYILKKGVRHSYIIDGDRVNVIGDGRGTVPLTETQAKNFENKLAGKSDKPVSCPRVSDAPGAPVVEGITTHEGEDLEDAKAKAKAREEAEKESSSDKKSAKKG